MREPNEITALTLERLSTPFFRAGAECVYMALVKNRLFVGRKPPVRNEGRLAPINFFCLQTTEDSDLAEAVAFLAVAP